MHAAVRAGRGGKSAHIRPRPVDVGSVPTERYLTFRLGMDNEALAGERGVPDDGQIGARRARAYEELSGRLREEPGVTDVTYGDRLPTMSPELVALEMEQDGAPPTRLHGNFEGGFAMAAVGPGYHDAFGATIVAGRALQAADAGAPNGPVVVNEVFMRVVGRNPWVSGCARSRKAATASLDPGTESSAWSPIWGRCSPPIGLGQRTSVAQPRRRNPILSWSLCASPGTQRRLRHASLPLRGRSMRACTSGISLPSTTSSHRNKNGWWAAASSSAAFCWWRWSSRRPVCTAHGRCRGASHPQIGIRIALGANPGHVLGSVFARAGRQLGGGIIAGNSLILLLAWRADSLTAELLVSSVITSVIMAVVGVLACAAPARRAVRVQPTEALRQIDVCPTASCARSALSRCRRCR